MAPMQPGMTVFQPSFTPDAAQEAATYQAPNMYPGQYGGPTAISMGGGNSGLIPKAQPQPPSALDSLHNWASSWLAPESAKDVLANIGGK